MPAKRSINFNALSIGLIVAIGFFIYLNSLQVPFQFDDRPYIENNPTIRTFPDMMANIKHFGLFRLVGYVSFAINYQLHGYAVVGYHLTNIIIHILNGILVWWLMRQLLRRQENKRSHILPLAAALLFVVHPLQTQAVTYLTQRFASLATFFYLLSVCLYLHARLSVPEPRQRRYFYSLTLMTAVLGMFTKQIAFTIPFMIMLMESMFVPHKPEAYRKILLRLLFPMLVLAAVVPLFYGFNMIEVFGRTLEPGNFADGEITSDTYFLTQLGVMVQYLALMLIPVGQSIDHYVPVANEILDPVVLCNLIILSVLLAWALRLRRTHRIISFGIFWFFITSSVESTVIPIRHVMFEHRMYLPSVGIIFTIVMLMDAVMKNDKNFKMLLAILVTLGCVLTMARNSIWQDEITLWSDALQKSPANPRPYYNLGVAYMKRGNLEEARQYFDKAIALHPEYFEAYNNRAHIYSLRGDSEAALRDINQAIASNPRMAVAYNTRGLLLQARGDCKEATKDFSKAIELDRTLTGAYINRSLCYGAGEKYALAIDDVNKAIEQEPNLPQHYNIRGAMFLGSKEWEPALKDFNEALRLDPAFMDARHNRGLAYLELGHWPSAIDDFSEILAQEADNPKTLLLRAKAYQDSEQWENALRDYGRLLSIDPNNLLALTRRAFVYTIRQNFAVALEDYNRVLKLNPHVTQAYLERGKLLYRIKEFSKALADYDQVILLEPENGEAYYLRALTKYELKQYQPAYDDLLNAQLLGVPIEPAHLKEFKKNLGVQ